MDPLEILEMIKAKRDEEKHNLMLLVVHLLLTTTQDSEFEVSMETLEKYCKEGDRDLTFERSTDGFVRLCAVTRKNEEIKTSAEAFEELADKTHALAEALKDALKDVFGSQNHGKH